MTRHQHDQGADRIPFPAPARPTACRRTPGLFDVAYGEATAPEAAERIRAAKAACRRCPFAVDCLRWALTHPAETSTNIWAGTTAGERTRLRTRLEQRLGPAWGDVLADTTRERRTA